ncbi:MAG: hypothetical protein LIO77_09725 [Rikenellaceae bacterium]|nr:hypothetical protein [Rikenellaceae bacterium]
MAANKFWRNLKTETRKFVSPVFVALLVLSTLLWYLTKLSYTYQTQIPFTVEVEGNRFNVECVTEGTGYRLVSYKYFKKNVINLNFRDIQTTPSVIKSGSYVINPYSLQNAISVRTADMRIISVGDLPEITLQD